MFNFENAVSEVSIGVDVHHRKDGVIQSITVEHLFRTPTAAELDKHRKLLTQFRGRKPKINFTAATAYLWSKCIIRVKGYEGLPENWREFFLNDEQAKIHVYGAVEGLLEFASPDGEFEKNSQEPSES